jgi:hypothetical protein
MQTYQMKNFHIKIFLLLLVVLSYFSSGAQNFGGFPPATKWKQINTDTARIIFDAATEEQAQRIATLIHKMAAEKPVSIGSDSRKINILLHKNTTLANGYVALAPFRSEYYLIPSSNIFDLGSIPWNEQLAIHEYRHVQQYNNFNKGLTKAFRFVLGEEGQALANAATIPNWFFEGDAVHSETALTPQGRGRLPYFLSGYNSLWQAGKHYSLMKLLNGSLKDYVPDHYQFGYLVTNYGYQKYGADFWKKVTADAAAFKGVFYPFRKAIKERAGVSYPQFISDALKEYSREIKEDADDKASKQQTVTNYYFPQQIGKDSLLYLKDSYKKLPAFYVRTKSGERRIKLKNIGPEDWFSYRNGIIAYTAYNTDARWSLTDFSEIILLNAKTGAEKRLTQKKKYFTPDISPSANQIIAVSVNDSVQTELHLLNMEGDVQKIISSGNRFFVHPRFLDNENIVVGIRNANGLIALHQMNLATGSTEQVTPLSYNVVGYPSVSAGHIYFTAAYKGNDDLYVVNVKDKKIFQLTAGQTGNYYPQVLNDTIAWSKFTSEGLLLQKAALANLLRQEINISNPEKQTAQYPVTQTTANLLATPTKNFPVRPYKKGTELFNFHSWRPYYDDAEFTFSLYGDNILNTFSSEVFYRYNQNEHSHGAGFNAAYGALFPVLRAGAEYTFHRNVTIRTPQGLRAGQLNAYEVSTGYYIPLNFSGGKTYKFLTFGSNYVFNRQMPVGSTKNILSSFSNTYLHHFINWQQQLPRTVQQIYPKFGYTVSGAYRHQTDEKGYQSLSNGNLYLPSFGNHSIVLSGSYQEVDTSNILFSNRFTNSRGYTDSYYSRMWRASANYHFPIAYPDWGFGGIVYFLRVRGNAFYDFTKVYAKDKITTAGLRSTGAEIFFDTKWWNQLPVTIGFRYSYLLDAEKLGLKRRHSWEIVIPTSLIPE